VLSREPVSTFGNGTGQLVEFLAVLPPPITPLGRHESSDRLRQLDHYKLLVQLALITIDEDAYCRSDPTPERHSGTKTGRDAGPDVEQHLRGIRLWRNSFP
jgi:hypothetical protein